MGSHSLLATIITLVGVPSSAFISSFVTTHVQSHVQSFTALSATDRRRAVSTLATAVITTASTPVLSQASANADGESSATNTVVVAGATGQTGRRVLEILAGMPNLSVVAGVRDVASAEKKLGEASTVVRGAMVQKVPSIDKAGVEIKKLDVSDTKDALTLTLSGAKSLIIAVGFVPGNPLKMNDAAHAVDNVGTCKLIDAAVSAGITKCVLVSSILTNGRAWGKEKSPGFVVTNAFGNVLDEKLVAEKYLRASGIDYTIVRPGGLKAKPPTGELLISKEDTLEAGEISRDLVAEVCVASLNDKKAKNSVLEIIEVEGTEPKVFNGLNM